MASFHLLLITHFCFRVTLKPQVYLYLQPAMKIWKQTYIRKPYMSNQAQPRTGIADLEVSTT